MNERPHLARVGRGLHHETNPPHTRADHPQAQTAEQLIAQGKAVADVCRALEVYESTYQHRRHLYGGMQAEEAKRLTQLEKENGRLTKLLAEAELHNLMAYVP